MGVRSVGELVDFPPVIAARVLMAHRTGALSGAGLERYVTDEYAARDLAQSSSWPLRALRGIDMKHIDLLAEMGVNTVADMAALGDEAELALAAANVDNGFSERPSAPAVLIPEVIGSVSSSVRYTSFIQDAEVRDFEIELDKECFFPLPLSGVAPGKPPPPDAPTLGDVFTK